MTINDVFSIGGAILASLGGGAVVVIGLSSWLGRLIASRLKEEQRSEYARDLDKLKSQLSETIDAQKASHLRDLEVLRARLDQRSEDRTRKLEALMNHYKQQAEQFYGPLFNLVNHTLFIVHDVSRDLKPEVSEDKYGAFHNYHHKT